MTTGIGGVRVVAPRVEYLHTPKDVSGIVPVSRPLSLAERAWNSAAVRRTALLVFVALLWEGYARWLDDPLVLPTFSGAVRAFVADIASGVLIAHTIVSLRILLIGYSAGVAGATILAAFAVTTRVGNDVLSLATSMFNPLPGIALLPLALMWFGLGIGSILFVVIHSILWAVSLNAQTGLLGISPTQKMAAQNYGLSGPGLVFKVLVPSGFPSILTGLKIGWAFAWRTLIGAELVFGVSSGSGGLGWFIYERKNELATADVFAGLFMVVLVGLVVENVVFRTIEARTVRRWGMQQAA